MHIKAISLVASFYLIAFVLAAPTGSQTATDVAGGDINKGAGYVEGGASGVGDAAKGITSVTDTPAGGLGDAADSIQGNGELDTIVNGATGSAFNTVEGTTKGLTGTVESATGGLDGTTYNLGINGGAVDAAKGAPGTLHDTVTGVGNNGVIGSTVKGAIGRR